MVHTETVKCNGRLGEHFTLGITTSVYDEEIYGRKGIKIKAHLKHDPFKEPDVQLYKGEASVKLRINDIPAAKDTVYIDTTNSDETELMTYITHIAQSDKTQVLTIEADLNVDSEAEYITNTTVRDKIKIPSVSSDRLYLTLTLRESDEIAYCSISTNTKYDFLEYKIDDTNWVKLEDTTQFSFRKSGKNQYIQARGKKDDYYSFSNVERIFEQR